MGLCASHYIDNMLRYVGDLHDHRHHEKSKEDYGTVILTLNLMRSFTMYNELIRAGIKRSANYFTLRSIQELNTGLKEMFDSNESKTSHYWGKGDAVNAEYLVFDKNFKSKSNTA